MSLPPLRISAVTTTPPGTSNSGGTLGSGTGTKTVFGAGSTSTASAAGPAGLDREAFLKLLVAQLRYQDPSKPMDASAMISQSAQLSVVDKLGEISTSLQKSAVTDKLILAGSVIGKQITFNGTDGYPVSRIVNSVRFADDGSMILSATDWDVPMDSVTSISSPGGTPPPTAPPATGTTAPPATGTTPPPVDPPTTPPVDPPTPPAADTTTPPPVDTTTPPTGSPPGV